MELLFITIMLMTVVTIRTGVYLLPNKNLMLGNFEVHHYLSGLVIALLSVLLLPWGSLLQIVVLAIGSGLVVDEIGFIAIRGIDDADYWSRYSVGISVVAVTVVTSSILFVY